MSAIVTKYNTFQERKSCSDLAHVIFQIRKLTVLTKSIVFQQENQQFECSRRKKYIPCHNHVHFPIGKSYMLLKPFILWLEKWHQEGMDNLYDRKT